MATRRRIIRNRLEDMEWTQRQLSEATGIHATTLSLIINSKLEPNDDQVEKISAALDRKPQFLGFSVPVN